MTLPKGTSLFYRESKKRWGLSYADPVRGQPQKVLPKEIMRQRDAEAWARERLKAQGLHPDAALTQRREQGPKVAECAQKWIAPPEDVPEQCAWLREIRELRAALTVRNIYYTFSTFYADVMAEGWIRNEANILEHPGVKREIPDARNDEREAMWLPLVWAGALIQSPRIALERRARYAAGATQ